MARQNGGKVGGTVPNTLESARRANTKNIARERADGAETTADCPYERALPLVGHGSKMIFEGIRQIVHYKLSPSHYS